MASYINYLGRADAAKFKLCPTLLDTSLPTNNLAAYPDGAKDSPFGYLSNTGLSPPVVYGLPSGGAVGTTIAGQQIFPTFNNRALYTPENCEVRSGIIAGAEAIPLVVVVTVLPCVPAIAPPMELTPLVSSPLHVRCPYE